MARCDFDPKKKSHFLAIHLRPDSGTDAEEVYVQFDADLCDRESAGAFRELADVIEKSPKVRAQNEHLEFLEVAHDDGLEEQRKEAFASINAGFKRLTEITEAGRTRRVLTGSKTAID